MNPVRNWVLVGLFYAAVLAAVLWYSFVSFPSAVLDPAGEPTDEQIAGFLLWGTGLLVFLAAAVLCFVLWFALSNRDMNRLTDGWFLTPLWTVLLFIPLVQFVGLYLMAQHIRRAQAAVGRTGLEPVVVFVFLWLLLPVGVALAQWQMQRVTPIAERTGSGLSDPASEVPGLDWRQVPGDAGIQESVRHEPATVGPGPGLPDLWSLREETLHAGPGPAGVSGQGAVARRAQGEAELLPMPASAVAACFFCLASVPLGLLGPAGLASSFAGLYARERFLEIRMREPGHRGGRFVSRLHWVALAGMLVSFIVSAGMLGAIFAAP